MASNFAASSNTRRCIVALNIMEKVGLPRFETGLSGDCIEASAPKAKTQAPVAVTIVVDIFSLN